MKITVARLKCDLMPSAFRNLNSTVPVDFIRVKCYLNSLLKLYESTSALDRNPPTMSEVRDTPITNNHGGTNSLTQ